MGTRVERLESKLARGEVLIGTHVSLPEPMILEMLARLDSICFGLTLSTIASTAAIWR